MLTTLISFAGWLTDALLASPGLVAQYPTGLAEVDQPANEISGNIMERGNDD